MATHSSILAWKILQTEEPGGLKSMGLQRLRHNWMTNTFYQIIHDIFFTEPEQIILKFPWNHKRPWIAKAVLRNKNNAEGIIPPDFRQYYKATVIKTVQYGHKNRHIYQQTRMESPQNKPPHLQSISLWQKRQKYTMEKNLSSKWGWKSWTTACKNQWSYNTPSHHTQK